MADSFYVDNMTVNEILNLSNDVISKMNTRDISRALRTVSLAANKRVNRLLSQTKKTKDGYVLKKSAQYNIAVDALNAVTKDGKQKVKFGVKHASTRNEMIEQLGDIRKFMGMKTSTIQGAKNVRREREQRLFGTTTEKASRGKTKKEKKAITKKFSDKVSEAYATFRKFLEHEGMPNSPYMRFAGSESVLNLIGSKIINGEDEEDALTAAINFMTRAYEEEQETWNQITSSDDFWEVE